MKFITVHFLGGRIILETVSLVWAEISTTSELEGFLEKLIVA
jgi:hypothetical protein